jgi:hypothetical protein
MAHAYREQTKAAAAARRDELAGHVSEGLSITAAAKLMGIRQQRASQLWRRIIADLGWQAAL